MYFYLCDDFSVEGSSPLVVAKFFPTGGTCITITIEYYYYSLVARAVWQCNFLVVWVVIFICYDNSIGRGIFAGYNSAIKSTREA